MRCVRVWHKHVTSLVSDGQLVQAACLRTADAFGLHHVDVIDKYAPFRVNRTVVTGA